MKPLNSKINFPLGIVLGCFLLFNSILFGQSKKEQIELLNKRVDSLNQVVGNERNTNTDNTNQIKELNSKITSFEENISELNLKISKIISELQSTKSEVESKQQEITNLKTLLKQKDDSLEMVKADLEKLKFSNESFTESSNTSTPNQITQIGSYKSIKIGSQTWMAENLSVSQFRNGDPIPQARNLEEWQNSCRRFSGEPAWCYYDFSDSNSKYGKFYNYYAMKDPRGIAPEGWKIPSVIDIEKLKETIGENSGLKLKSLTGWKNYGCKTCDNPNLATKNWLTCPSCNGKIENSNNPFNGNGADEFNFNANPIGFIINGGFNGFGENLSWWLCENDGFYGDDFFTLTNSSNFIISNCEKGENGNYYGMAIRCLNEIEDISIGKFETFLNETDKRQSFNFVKIRGQYWMAENLNVSTFQNGDSIQFAKNSNEFRNLSLKSIPCWGYEVVNNKKEKVYNTAAIKDKRGLTPKGWHIPKISDWDNIFNYPGSPRIEVTALKLLCVNYNNNFCLQITNAMSPKYYCDDFKTRGYHPVIADEYCESFMLRCVKD